MTADIFVLHTELAAKKTMTFKPGAARFLCLQKAPD